MGLSSGNPVTPETHNHDNHSMVMGRPAKSWWLVSLGNQPQGIHMATAKKGKEGSGQRPRSTQHPSLSCLKNNPAATDLDLGTVSY